MKDRLFFDASLQYYTRYFEEGSHDMLHEPFLRSSYGNNSITVPHEKDLSYWGHFHLDRVDPDISMKLRARWGNNFKLGIMNYSGKGELGIHEKTAKEIIKDSKFYAGYENTALPFLDNTRLKLYLGHYRATYGEGLVMENTDFYSARKTGFGFSKRILGLTPDLSKTQEYALRGAALEVSHPLFTVSAWGSVDDKDAIVYVDQNGDTVKVNGKDKVFSYVVPSIRFENDDMRAVEAKFNTEIASGTAYAVPYINLAYRKDAFREKLWHTLQVNPWMEPGWDSPPIPLCMMMHTSWCQGYNDLRTLLVRDSYYYPKFKMLDAEIAGLYSTYKPGSMRETTAE